MAKTDESGDPPGVTVGIVVAAIACCAVPLLVAAGVLTAAGAVLQNLLIIAVGASVLGWAITRVVRSVRARNRSSTRGDHTRA